MREILNGAAWQIAKRASRKKVVGRKEKEKRRRW